MLIPRRTVEHRCRRTWLAVLTLCSLTAGLGRLNLVQAQQAATSPPDRPAVLAVRAATASKAGPKQPRIREGTALVEQAGVFQKAGDRVTFFTSDGQRRFVVLENLQLERISRAIGDNLAPPQWTVSGTVTEFGGANYLFVDRAVLRATVPSGQQGRRPWADPRAAPSPHNPPALGDLNRP
jgi:hypothetical protein